MKTCNKCNEERQLNQFGLDKRNKDGLQGICEVCRKQAKQSFRANKQKQGNPTLVSTKICNKCLKDKKACEFYKDSGIADGLATICKDCKDVNTKKWKEDNRDKYNKDMRDWRAQNKDAAKSHDLMRCYGITLERYNEMLSEQNNVCAICKKPPKGKRPLVVDHCHKTDKVRQLLCYGCNRLIVTLDNHPLHQKLVDYLKKT